MNAKRAFNDGPGGGNERPADYGIDLLWIPLGAGGWFVQFNGRVWETIQARRERRPPDDLFHSALVVRVPEGRFTIENAWPIPGSSGKSRGVVAEGPVFSRWLGAFRIFRYEVRCWRDGVIDDAKWAVGGPRRISDRRVKAWRVLDRLPDMPSYVWGRQIPGTGDMWNSNSTISWVLTRSGIDAARIEPPPAGRAPGWQAGISVARRQTDPDSPPQHTA